MGEKVFPRGGGVSLTFNGKSFVAGAKALATDSAATGYYVAKKRKIELFSRDNELAGVVTCHGVLACASKMADGKTWFSYADIKIIGPYASYRQHCDEISAALEACSIARV
jgi:hypothetical protein